MLKKILSLVLNYDTRMEKKSTGRPRLTRESLATPETRSEQSGRSFYSPSNKMEIPDPWD
jgi:hypothetical protein